MVEIAEQDCSDRCSIAYQNGKLDALNTLSSVLKDMKSDNANNTSLVMNLILDEIYEKVAQELV